MQVPPQGGRKHPEQKMVSIDTKNILFICGGAIDGIDRVIGKRLSTQAIGYNANKKENIDKDNLLQYVSPQDLKGYGLIPELIGRLPVLTHLKSLDKDALRQILTEPKNSLTKQYVKLFEMDGITLSIDDEVLDYIVEKAIDFKLGARGLRSICETIMIDAMFDGPSDSENNKELKLSLEYAQNKIENSTLQKLKVA